MDADGVSFGEIRGTDGLRGCHSQEAILFLPGSKCMTVSFGRGSFTPKHYSMTHMADSTERGLRTAGWRCPMRERLPAMGFLLSQQQRVVQGLAGDVVPARSYSTGADTLRIKRASADWRHAGRD